MTDLLRLVDTTGVVNATVAYAPRLAAALVVLAFFWVLQRVTRPPLALGLRRAGIQETLVRMLVDHLYRLALLVLAIIMAADQLGFNVMAALAGLSVAGLAIGLAAQDSLANMIAGFLILWDKPFVVGDHITVQEQYGKVAEVTLRSTRIRTPANTYVVLPNRHIIDAVLVNHTKHGETRVGVPVGIAYKESVPGARQVLLEAARSVEGVLDDPAPEVVTMELGGSSVNLEVRVWVDEPELERPVFSGVLEACKLALDEAGIQIPYPHLQLFVDNVEDRVWSRAASLPGLARTRPDAVASVQPAGRVTERESGA